MNETQPATAFPGAADGEVALFVTCLADLFRPSVAFDALELLQRAGCKVVIPETQTCCPINTAGRCALTRISASFSISAGSPIDLTEAR